MREENTRCLLGRPYLVLLTIFSALALWPTVGAEVKEIPIPGWYLSGDGGTVVGCLRGQDGSLVPYKWTADEGNVALPHPFPSCEVTSVSFDGRTIVGRGQKSLTEPETRIVLWDGDQSHLLIADGEWSKGCTFTRPVLSGNGKTIVGGISKWSPSGALSWRPYMLRLPLEKPEEARITLLTGLSPGRPEGQATGVSADGSIIVGSTDVGVRTDLKPLKDLEGERWENNMEATVWDRQGKPVGLGRPEGAYQTDAEGCSRDGKHVFGWADLPHYKNHIFVWSRVEGLTLIPAPQMYSNDSFISLDGAAVFGSFYDGQRVWTASTGFRPIAEYLRTRGPEITGYVIDSVSAISDDMKTLIAIGHKVKGKALSLWIRTK